MESSSLPFNWMPQQSKHTAIFRFILPPRNWSIDSLFFRLELWKPNLFIWSWTKSVYISKILDIIKPKGKGTQIIGIRTQLQQTFGKTHRHNDDERLF